MLSIEMPHFGGKCWKRRKKIQTDQTHTYIDIKTYHARTYKFSTPKCIWLKPKLWFKQYSHHEHKGKKNIFADFSNRNDQVIYFPKCLNFYLAVSIWICAQKRTWNILWIIFSMNFRLVLREYLWLFFFTTKIKIENTSKAKELNVFNGFFSIYIGSLGRAFYVLRHIGDCITDCSNLPSCLSSCLSSSIPSSLSSSSIRIACCSCSSSFACTCCGPCSIDQTRCCWTSWSKSTLQVRNLTKFQFFGLFRKMLMKFSRKFNFVRFFGHIWFIGLNQFCSII